ncbi:MAG: c-type cytochrome domain-containing protein [Acidobacteriota bacterium]
MYTSRLPRLAVRALCCVILPIGFSAAAAPPGAPFTADPFLQKNCTTCHGVSKPAGRLDLTHLNYEPADPDNYATWVKIHDRVAIGEMPPRGLPRPAPESLTQFVRGLAGALTEYDRGVKAERG